MPVVNYIQNNDYNLVKDIRPFDMPYSSYMSEIATKNQYFKIGADRVKSVYDQAAGLNPQYTQGKEYLKGFMTEAQKNLEKLTKSDLGILDNAQQASRIFKPLFDTNNPLNQALLMDSQLNDHYQKQQQISDTYRTKDGGKEWNQNNERYFRDAQFKYQQDAENGDYSTIESNFQNKKSYIPYYDYKKELTDIQEACKGFSSDIQDISSNQMYFQRDTKKGCDPQRLATAYQTGLSDRAKQQIHIDGYSLYKGNERQLLTDFNDYSINRANNEIKMIEASIEGLKAGGITKEEQAKITDYTQILNIKKERYDKSLEKYQAMTKGNPEEYLKNNFESVAGTVYFDSLTNQLGDSFRTDDVKRIVSPNAVAMQDRKYFEERATQLRGFNHDFAMNADDWKYKEKEITMEAQKAFALARLKGEISGESSELPTRLSPGVFDEKNPPQRTENDFKNKELAPAQAINDANHKTLIDYIDKKYKIKDEAAVTKFLNEHNGKLPKDQDPILARLYKNFDESANTLKSKINMMDAVDEQAKAIDPTLYDDSKYSDKKILASTLMFEDGIFSTKKVNNTIPLSEKDMYHILNGKNIGGFTAITRLVPVTGGSGTKVTNLYFNGQAVKNGFNSDSGKLIDMFNKVKDTNKDNFDKLNDIKTKIYTDDWVSNGNLTKNTITIKKDGKQDHDIRTMLGVGGGQGEANGYEILAQSATGEGIYIQPLDANKIPIIKKDDAILKRIGGSNANNTVEELPGFGNAYLLHDIASRYSGLGSEADMKKYKTVIQNMRNISRLLNASPLSKGDGSGFVSSEELNNGRGILTTKTNTGLSMNVTVRKEATGLIYVATNPANGATLEAGTPEELVTLINSL